ncbi:MAG: hypothetical protein M3O55_08235 [Actinomycetota bacterium]|nr:hypothetical protein [Actinomycetota bacterium]
MGVLKKREAIADRVGAVRAPAGAKAGPVGKPTVIAAGSEAAQVTRNNRNTRATAVANTLAEPGAANEGQKVFYTGNTFASKSSNGGVSWSAVALPAGPADASIACCDLDVLRVHNRDRIITSLLYTNAAQTNGVVRLFVRNDPLNAPLCTYTIDPGGTADNLLPDYPHIAVSSNFLYLSTNSITGGSWTGAQIRRFNLAQMSACGSVSFNTFTWTGAVGQRILTPVQGAKTIMYFGSNESSTQFRIFSWPESTTTITTGLRTVGLSNFVNPDCRGGVGNFDFIERSTAWSIAGFRLRGATGGGKVTFWWPVGADANHPQAHLHGVSLAVSNLAVTAEPPVWNGGTCFSYPSVASNTAGDYGLTLAFGGQAGGGGTAAQGAVAVDDADSAGIFFPSLLLTAQGTHNRSDARYGDYFTIRTNARCNQNWVATNYALLNGATTSAHVNARYIEFQSSLRAAC